MAYPKAISTTAAILIFFLLASPLAEGPAPSHAVASESEQNHALIIGINNYQNWSKLQSAVQDAEALGKMLVRKYNFSNTRLTFLTDRSKEKPTLINILSHMEKAANELTEQDNLVLFFAGHSAEDDDGETYWIPIDGKKKARLTWLKHSDIINDLFASETFKAKNFCLITDSLFAYKLIRPRSISLTPYDLRYSEKIVEMASRSSREVIAFGDRYWAGDKNTDGLGLFAYYIVKALNDNTLEFTDFENLIFDENVLFAISKIAGTKMLRGRIRTPNDKGGQLVIAKVAPMPPVDVIETRTSPTSGYPGDHFEVTAKTNAKADQVFVEIQGQKHPMQSSGALWKYKTQVTAVGETSYRVVAINPNGMAGQAVSGKITTVRQRAKTLIDVETATVEPQEGFSGDVYVFRATTSGPAQGVALRIGEQTFQMAGTGNQWHLSRPIDATGILRFEVSAVNQDGVAGKPDAGEIRIAPGISNVTKLQAAPSEGYAGEEYTLTVKTDRPADRVILQSKDGPADMQGSGRSWQSKITIAGIGTQRFTATARNASGEKGQSQSVTVMTRKSPLAVPSISVLDVRVVDPGKGYAGDNYVITVETSAPSQAVYLDLEERRLEMSGSGTRWDNVVQIDKVGRSVFKVFATNEDGVQGPIRDGEIETVKKPAPRINVMTATVQPAKGDRETVFTFNATTDQPANRVILQIGPDSYAMAGSGSQWQLSRKMSSAGTTIFSIAALNEDGVAGADQSTSMTVLEKRYQVNADGTITDQLNGRVQKRFKDNGDGTVTDLLTRLMWLQRPKQIALKWEDAIEYCRNLDYKGIGGWRLPTIRELQAITDKSQQNPALPPEHPFNDILTHMGYWSKSKHKFGPKYVYQMNLWFGKIGYQRKDEYAIVWPVRYAAVAEEG